MNTTPFFTNMGFHPSFDASITTDMNNPAAQELSVCLHHIHKELCAELAHSDEQMATYYNHKQSSPPEYSPGDLVLLLRRNIKITRPSNKLDYHYLGPFKICGRSVYLLKLPSSLSRLHPVFNVDLLEPYTSPSTIDGRLSPPTPHVQIRHDQHNKVLDVRKLGRCFKYFVKWENLDSTENSWVPLSDVPRSSDELLETYHHRHPTISISPHAPSQCHTEIHTHNFAQRYTPTMSITSHAPSQCHTEIHTPTISITSHAPSQCQTEIHTYNFDFTTCTLTMSN